MRAINIILNSLDVVAPLLALLFFMRRPKISKELLPIFIFCVIQLIFNFLASVLGQHEIRNYWVYKINTILSFYIILYFFLKYLISVKKYVVTIIALVFLMIFGILFLKGDGITNYDSNSAALASLIIVGLCMYFFYSKLITKPTTEVSVPDTSIFWCIIGIFTYYAGAFFIFISYRYLIDTSTVGTLWRFHNLLLLICCLYISYGILCKNLQTI